MEMQFRGQIAAIYKSPSQRARVLSEDWVARNLYCPGCGAAAVSQYGNNRPAADFFCATCAEEFELKSKPGRFGSTVPDGAYRAMMERIASSNNPNLLLLSFDRTALTVNDVVVVPRHFLIPDIIRMRSPLRLTARRAGWVGCTIALDGIPQAGRITLVRNGLSEPKAAVTAHWRATLFLREQTGAGKSWLLRVMQCIESLGLREFTIDAVYSFEEKLRLAYPNNQHIRPKIRQQLQVLRDSGFLEFSGRGRYRLRVP